MHEHRMATAPHEDDLTFPEEWTLRPKHFEGVGNFERLRRSDVMSFLHVTISLCRIYEFLQEKSYRDTVAKDSSHIVKKLRWHSPSKTRDAPGVVGRDTSEGSNVPPKPVRNRSSTSHTSFLGAAGTKPLSSIRYCSTLMDLAAEWIQRGPSITMAELRQDINYQLSLLVS